MTPEIQRLLCGPAFYVFWGTHRRAVSAEKAHQPPKGPTHRSSAAQCKISSPFRVWGIKNGPGGEWKSSPKDWGNSGQAWGSIKASGPNITLGPEVNVLDLGAGNLFQVPFPLVTPPGVPMPPRVFRALGPVMFMIRSGTRVTNWILKIKAFNSLTI